MSVRRCERPSLSLLSIAATAKHHHTIVFRQRGGSERTAALYPGAAANSMTHGGTAHHGGAEADYLPASSRKRRTMNEPLFSHGPSLVDPLPPMGSFPPPAVRVHHHYAQRKIVCPRAHHLSPSSPVTHLVGCHFCCPSLSGPP